jgi:NADPH-dependent curcumin reductase CurA
MPINKGFVLASRPQGEASARNFRFFEAPAPRPGAGEVLVRHHYLSLDPYMRGRMDESRSYAASQKLDEVMIGGTVGEVVASNDPGFALGDKVVGQGGWQLYGVARGAELRKLPETRAPIQAFLGALGMPGVTAWHGANRILEPEPGQTLVVSAATGAVGAVVGQLAKARGARVVGIAGGAEKCGHAVNTLGFDACVDHRAPAFEADLAAATPQGIDRLFENVGGAPFRASFRRLNDFGRVAICGLIASYEGAAATTIEDMRLVLVRRIMIQGFIVMDRMEEWPRAIAELAGLAESGKLTWRETIAQGIESAPEAFFGMLKGRNFGKQLVKLI